MARVNKSRAITSVAALFFTLLFVLLVLNFKSTNKSTKINTLQPKPEINKPKPCNYMDTINYLHYRETVSNVKNKFGLYIYAEVEDYFDLAQKLVNSNGGDWGYVLIPFNVKDRNSTKWRRVFEQLNNKHLIPILQLHDVNIESYKTQTKKAARFLNSFIWPIKQRYISVYNEPNSANFWYGNVNPAEYAKILNYTIDTFKKEDKKFFMLNGALNVSAASDSSHLDAFEFMKLMDSAIPGIFAKLDGWASHPYPQPNFSGSPTNTGRNSIRAYENELNYLKNRLNLTKDLPVFITETGWAHSEGAVYNPSYLSSALTAEYIKQAYENVWLKDAGVGAVIPFTIRYKPPFDHFSWVNQYNKPYESYKTIQNMEKVAGTPQILVESSFNIVKCP